MIFTITIDKIGENSESLETYNLDDFNSYRDVLEKIGYNHRLLDFQINGKSVKAFPSDTFDLNHWNIYRSRKKDFETKAG